MLLWRMSNVRIPALSSCSVTLLACGALSLLAAGCSSSPTGSSMPSPVETPAPVLASITVPCNISSGYPGDDVCIKAPDPKDGFQFHFGPANYTDPAEIAKYILMPGEEKTECVFMESVNTETAYIQEYHSRLRPGSHHLLNYVQPTTGPIVTSTAPTACNQNQNFRMLFGATSEKMDVARASPGPENEGMAVQLGPKQQVALQLHVINATAKPILREAWANFRYADKSTVTELADPIQFMAGVISSIPVGTTVVNSGTATVPANAAPDFRLVAAIPHFHAHTTDFKVYKTTAGVKSLILEQFGTLGSVTEPTLVQFASSVQNQPINESTQTPGAASGIMHLAPGDSIEWECTQTNDGNGAPGQTFTTPLAFTEQVYTGEMCNLFGLYAPTTGSDWGAIGLKQTVVSTH
jgi:hypothetical protein